MTGQEAIRKLQECQAEAKRDWEAADSHAEEVILKFLRANGFEDVAEAFEKVGVFVP